MSRRTVQGYVIAVFAVAAATLAGVALGQRASLADEAMLYALAILIAALAGRGPGLVAAGLSIATFDFFFVDPRFTLDVSDPRFFITFAVMFAAGVAIGSLGARLRAAEAASREREKRTAALLSFTRDAAAATDPAGVIAAVVEHLRDAGIAATVREPFAIDTSAKPLDLDQQQFVESVARQAEIAIEKLRLATAAREAEVAISAEKLRTALLSAVSHDLRTPLAVITGMASTLRETAPNNEHEELDIIVSEGARLGRIVENLLAATKVEAGAAPRREWVPVEELVGSALERLATALADRTVEVSIPGEVLAHIDPVLGELLLVNLLDNATKHTPGGVAIELAARREDHAAIIEVADRGPGLAPGSEQQIFERFFRGNRSGGVGLGLAVCRGIVAAHGGTIEASNRDSGTGARFTVRIPDAAPLPQLDDELPAIAQAGERHAVGEPSAVSTTDTVVEHERPPRSKEVRP